MYKTSSQGMERKPSMESEVSVVNDTNDTLVLQYCIAILCQSNINPGS